MKLQRSITVPELSAASLGKRHTISGWVSRIRTHKRTIFIDVRDRDDRVQVVFDARDAHLFEIAQTLGREDVVTVAGKFVPRQQAAVNLALRTGEWELIADALEIYNHAAELPFPLNGPEWIEESLRLKHRYLDLRQSRMQRNLRMRAHLVQQIRRYLEIRGFIEVETPILTNSTPEGARDFLVPSRLHSGRFYALPQSPQQFKQLLMVGGIDRYYQIARCFRDEDSRGDRQPEFTQLDIEMAFVTPEDIISLISGLLEHLCDLYNVKRPTDTIRRMTYHEALSRYGSDKPDTRFGLEIEDLAPDIACHIPLKAPLSPSGRIATLRIASVDSMTQMFVENLVAPYGNDQFHGVVVAEKKGLLEWQKIILQKFNIQRGECLVVGCGENWDYVSRIMGDIRLQIAEILGARNPTDFDLLWVTDFPLVEWNQGEHRWYAVHHPFTAPHLDDANLLKTSPGKVRAQAYDIVMQGVEIGGGSIRIHERKIQEQMFGLLGIEQTEALQRFGHMLEAFDFGTPPHGGIALGLDRLLMLFLGEPSIREVIAFPKTSSGVDLLTGAPSEVSSKQLREANIRVG
jgi:aspartyl-tRNA synthetase